MTSIPPDVLAAIERDVERYRRVRIAAAEKRQTPEYQRRLAKRREYDWLRDRGRIDIMAWFIAGESLDDIANRLSFVKKNRIKAEVEAWLVEALNRDFDGEWTWPPRFSENEWRALAKSLLP